MQKLTGFILLLLVFSCTKKDQSSNKQNSGQTQSKPLWSIVRGNYWVYRDSSFDDNGSFFGVAPSDTLRTTDSLTYQGNVYYGKDTFYITTVYFRLANDSTVEGYEPGPTTPYIYFRQVKANNTIINNSDVIISNAHNVITQIGYTDITNLYGYDCIRNETNQVYAGNLEIKTVIYVKQGIGVVRYARYVRNRSSGKLNIYFSRTLVSYKVG